MLQSFYGLMSSKLISFTPGDNINGVPGVRDRDMSLKLYTGLSLLILVVIFTIQNVEIVQINFLMWNFSISRALMIFLVFSIGTLVGWTAAKHYSR